MDASKFKVPESGNQAGNVKDTPAVAPVTNATAAKVPTTPMSHEEAKQNNDVKFRKGTFNKSTQTPSGRTSST